MKTIIANAFSLQMVNQDMISNIDIVPIDGNTVSRCLMHNDFISCVGHTDTANVLSDLLGVNITPNRVSVKLDVDTLLIVAQVVGGRLPEGATTLPDSVTIKFFAVKLISNRFSLVE